MEDSKMPERWTGNISPHDLTGRIGHELARKAREKQQEKTEKYYADIEAAKAEIERLKRPVRIAVENINFNRVIDYTDGEARKYAEQRARTARQLTEQSPDYPDPATDEE